MAYDDRMTPLPRPRPGADVDIAQMRPMLALIDEAGLPREKLLTGAGLPDDLFQQPGEGQLSLSGYFRLCEEIALAVGDETIHISLRPLMLGTSDFIRDRLRAATRVREMLEILASSYNVIHGGQYNSVHLRRGELVIVIDDRDFPYAIDKDDPFVLFSLEALLVYVHVLLQSSSTSPRPLPLRTVRTRRRAGEGETALAAWGAPPVFGDRCFSLHYAGEAADWPVDPSICPVLRARTVYGGIARALDRMALPAPGEEDLIDRLERELRDGGPDQREIARRVGMSSASLRRRLAERGTSFRELRARTLRDSALARLGRGDPVARVAEELGFSDGRAFARAFRGWTGRSPRQYRGGARRS